MALKMTPKDVFPPTLNHTIISWKLKKIYIFWISVIFAFLAYCVSILFINCWTSKNLFFFKKSILAQKLIKGMSFRSPITIFHRAPLELDFWIFLKKVHSFRILWGIAFLIFWVSQSAQIDRYQKNNFTAF